MKVCVPGELPGLWVAPASIIVLPLKVPLPLREDPACAVTSPWIVPLLVSVPLLSKVSLLSSVPPVLTAIAPALVNEPELKVPPNIVKDAPLARWAAPAISRCWFAASVVIPALVLKVVPLVREKCSTPMVKVWFTSVIPSVPVLKLNVPPAVLSRLAVVRLPPFRVNVPSLGKGKKPKRGKKSKPGEADKEAEAARAAELERNQAMWNKMMEMGKKAMDAAAAKKKKDANKKAAPAGAKKKDANKKVEEEEEV